MKLVTGYSNIGNTMRDRVRVYNRIAKNLLDLKKKLKFTHIVCIGISGQSYAWPVATMMKVPVCVIRKSSEASHSGSKIEGFGNMKKYVILDDFISSGMTVDYCRKIIKEYDHNLDTKCVGICVYDRDSFSTNEKHKGIKIYNV